MIEVQNCIHQSANLELDAEVARFMCLPEVQPGHLTYWYTPTSCGWTAYAGPPPCAIAVKRLSQGMLFTSSEFVSVDGIGGNHEAEKRHGEGHAT